MKAKKIINIIIGVLLVVCIGLSVFLFIKYRNSEKEYDALLDRKNELALKYNSLLDEKKQLKSDYESLVTANEQLETDYETLLADYTELELLYAELQTDDSDIVYEHPTSLDDYDTNITYDDLMQNSVLYKGKAICISGIVTQMTSADDGICLLTIAADGDYNSLIDFVYDSNNIDAKISLNDNVDLYGLFDGLYSEDTKPLIIGIYVDVN